MELPQRTMNPANALDNFTRLNAIKRLSLLDSPPEEVFDRITRLISRLVNVPIALVSIVDKDRQFFKSQVGVGEPWATARQTPISYSFCQYVVTSGERLIVEDARKNPMLADSPAIPELDVIAYAGIPLTSPQGDMLGSVCMIDNKPRQWTDDEIVILEDMAATVMVEIELRNKVLELTDRNQDLDAFAHSVAHDLRGPLLNISGFTYILQEEGERLPHEQVKDYLDTIQRGTGRMVNIITALLLLAKVQQADVPVKPLESGEIVAEVLNRLAPMIEEYGAEIVVPEKWPAAMGYGPWIEEVWVNYVSNAMKYGGRPPHVELQATALPGHAVKFAVRDNGAGLNEEQKAKLFTPFTRLNQVNVDGQGLGLSIVRRIVEKLGGEVGVEDAPGGGSVFYFIMPGA